MQEAGLGKWKVSKSRRTEHGPKHQKGQGKSTGQSQTVPAQALAITFVSEVAS